MALPLQLPTLQNWNCHNCGGCCRQHAIDITPEEHRRIVSQNWKPADGIPAGQPLFERSGGLPWNKQHRLAHQPDGACVFLDERGLCRIHAKFGEEAKPLACRVYPYAFHPAGGKVAVSLRFSCPSVVADRGRPVREQQKDLKILEQLVVPAGTEKIAPPEISPGQRLDWKQTLSIVELFDDLLADETAPVSLRLLRGLFAARVLEHAKFNDPELRETVPDLLALLSETAPQEVSPRFAEYPQPGTWARVQFRQLAAQYSRKDSFAAGERGWKQRWKLMRAAVRFAKGAGLTPALHEEFAAVPFEDLESPRGRWPAEVDELFTRYFRVKLQGLHFCGRAYYDVPVVEGFQSLALMLPVVLWLARWLALGTGRVELQTEDVARALAIADHHHGFNPIFGQAGFRGRVRWLAKTGEIGNLVAWYSR